MLKTFTIKGKEIKIITLSNGKKALTPESMGVLQQLTMKYQDALRDDKDALEMAKYLKGE